MDAHGQSLDLHAVRDALLRWFKSRFWQSLLLDLAGGIVAALEKTIRGVLLPRP